MGIVYDNFEKLFGKALLKKIKTNKISAATLNQYDFFVKNYPDEAKNVSLEKFCAITSNWNPGKTGIGQDAQTLAVKAAFPNYKKLPNSGKNSVKLMKDNQGNINIAHKSGKSNLNNVKNFDGFDASTNTFFFLKTQDIGFYSESIGGGAQDNVIAELKTIISLFEENPIIYKGKVANLHVVIDGRDAKSIIAELKTIVSAPETTISEGDCFV